MTKLYQTTSTPTAAQAKLSLNTRDSKMTHTYYVNVGSVYEVIPFLSDPKHDACKIAPISRGRTEQCM